MEADFRLQTVFFGEYLRLQCVRKHQRAPLFALCCCALHQYYTGGILRCPCPQYDHDSGGLGCTPSERHGDDRGQLVRREGRERGLQQSIGNGSYRRRLTVVNDPESVENILFELATNGELSDVNYFLGGNINEISINETSVNPALRKAIYSVFANGPLAKEKLRNFIPNNVTGVWYNHHNVLEPDWRNACFAEVDPNHRFNCWNCVGYQGEENPPVGDYIEPECPVLAPSSEGNNSTTSIAPTVATIGNATTTDVPSSSPVVAGGGTTAPVVAFDNATTTNTTDAPVSSSPVAEPPRTAPASPPTTTSTAPRTAAFEATTVALLILLAAIGHG